MRNVAVLPEALSAKSVQLSIRMTQLMDTNLENLASRIRLFITSSFLSSNEEPISDDLDLIGTGILDSLAVVEIAGYLENLAGREIGGHELTPKNIGSIRAMTQFVLKDGPGNAENA